MPIFFAHLLLNLVKKPPMFLSKYDSRLRVSVEYYLNPHLIAGHSCWKMEPGRQW